MSAQAEIARIRAMIDAYDEIEINECARAIVERKREIMRRRIFALDQEISYANPFPDPVSEMLFKLWK